MHVVYYVSLYASALWVMQYKNFELGNLHTTPLH